ncbi:MAG: NACHT domain-containing protein [Cyanobacteria bacterium P01_F01_bin.116]
MSELVTTSVLTGVATPIFEMVWKTGEGLLGRFQAYRKRKLARHRINGALLDYEKRFKARHGRAKFIGKSEPIDVNLVFTNIEYIDNKGLCQGNDALQVLEMLFRDERRPNKNQSAERKSVFAIAKKTQHLMLLGGPGAGKTTFLRKVGMEALKPPKQSDYGHRCIPVFIALKRLVSKNTNIERLIQEEFEISGMPDSFEFTREALRMGKLLILLDGLDEIPYTNLQSALLKIKDFVDKYDANRYIASCREGAKYHRLLDSFTDVQIADFNDSQIENFVKVWFQVELNDEDEPQDRELSIARQTKFLKILQKDKNSAVRELARNPLLLTLLCLVYQGSNNLPNNRVSLFQQALELFINKWFALKKVQPNPILDQEFDPILERAMLSEVAHRGFISDRVFFPQRELVGHIRAYMEENLNAPDLDGQEVLDTIKIYQGILIDQVQNYCSFSHIAFQEYLTAQYIYDNNKIDELVVNHISDQRWKEVFSMVSGLLISGSDKLLQQMEQESRKLLIGNEKVHSLIAFSESTVSEKVQSFENKMSLCANHIEGKHLESYGWDLVVRHAATFYTLGGLLYSYNKALSKCEGNEIDFVRHKHNKDFSTMLTRYSSFIISEVYEYLSSKSVRASNKEESEYFFKLIGSIKNMGALSKSIIKIERSECNSLKLKKLRKQFQQAHIFHNVQIAPIRQNLELLEHREASRRRYSVDENKFLVTKMWQNWLHSLGLVPYDIMNMSRREMEVLEKYLYTNLLIVNCRIRAVKISHEAWNNTLIRMMQRAA